MLDGDLPSIIANLLLEQLNSGVSTLKELVEQITETNPLGYDTEQASPFYAYKIKHLLTSAALGMMPATAWSGKFDANGGYLVVKKDGEILCYHFYDRNRFEDYLSLMHIWNVQVLHAMNMHQSSKKMMVLFRSNSIFKLD